MATYEYALKYTIYDYSSVDLTEIPEEGEKRYFDTILTGITHPCYVLGDGSSQINALPFVGIINIETSSNINLEILRISGNRVLLENTHTSSITVNLGTTGSAINRTMDEDEIWEMKFNGTAWIRISSNYSVPVGSIIAFHKSLTGCPTMPDNFLECDGSVVSDSESPFNGQTLPDLNGDARFLRGGTVSGTEQDDAMQRITGTLDASRLMGAGVPTVTGVFTDGGNSGLERAAGTGNSDARAVDFDNSLSTSPNAAKTDDSETRPINMSVVWIIRIK